MGIERSTHLQKNCSLAWVGMNSLVKRESTTDNTITMNLKMTKKSSKESLHLIHIILQKVKMEEIQLDYSKIMVSMRLLTKKPQTNSLLVNLRLSLKLPIKMIQKSTLLKSKKSLTH